MCPASPHTAQLAFSCGVALAGNAQNDQANALFDQALAAPEANPKMFSKVALTQAEMKDEKRAMATLDVAEQRFAGGLFYSDRISVALANGDLASAKAAGDRCQKDGPDSQTKLTCSMLLAQSKAKT
jgi:Tfp pilus assembly protein PilF